MNSLNKKMDKYTGTLTLESMGQAGFYNKWTLSKFKKYLKGEILEVGCGIGNFTSTLSKFGKVTAIDIDKILLNTFKDHNNTNIKVGYGDIERGKYFFPKKTFDTVVCINVLEHINDDKKALQNIYTLLKVGGRLILLVPIHQFLYGEIDRTILHLRRYNYEDLKNQLQSIGFKVESSRKLNFLGALGWFIAGRILKNKQISENNIKLFNLFAPLTLKLEDLLEPPLGTSVILIARKGKK